MSRFHIRPFGERDWLAVRAIIDDVVESGASYTYDSDLSDEACRALWIETAPGQTVVAEGPDGTILGTAKMGRNQHGPGSHIASASIMVAREGRRRGVGRCLGEHAVVWATEAGFSAMQFNAVVSDNHAAVTLWTSLGFAVIGRVPDGFRHCDGRFADLLIMHRRL